MKTNATKRKLLAGEPAIGIVLWSGSAVAAGMLARAGVDFLVVDNQHGDWDDAGSMAAFRSISLGTAMPMARVRQNDFYAIGRLLDRGALGIMAPMVNSVAEARAAAFAMRYPPRGGRSRGVALADFHGPDYVKWIDDEAFLAVQIETPEAVTAAGEIMAVEGVDGCWVGPSDLAATMGVDFGSAAHDEAIMSVLEACRSVGKIPGIHALGLHDARKWLERGYRLVTVGAETDLMMRGAEGVIRELGKA